MTGSVGTGAGERNSTTHFPPSIKEIQVNVFYLFDFPKILFEERLQRLVFCFCCCVIFFESTGLDSIILRNLIKILKYRDVIFSSLFTFLHIWGCEFFEKQIKETQGKIISDILVLYFTFEMFTALYKRGKKVVIHFHSFFTPESRK